MKRAAITGVASYVPDRVLTNHDLEQMVDTNDEWIVSRTGIRERRRLAPDEHTSTIAAYAAKRALDDAGVTIDEVDVLICATATGDHQFPATATFVQAELGGRDIPAFDISAACAGFRRSFADVRTGDGRSSAHSPG